MRDWVKDKFGQDIWQLGKGQEKDWNTVFVKGNWEIFCKETKLKMNCKVYR